MTMAPISRLQATGAGGFSNEDFLLVGAIPSETGPSDESRVGRYAVFDAHLLAAGIAQPEAHLGQVEIAIRPDPLLIEGLNRMEIVRSRRHRGTGRRLIQALAATAPDFRLNIYDIEPAELDFWIALGVSFRAHPNGREAVYVLPSRLCGAVTGHRHPPSSD
jgi:GNAT superfamily N-acetyltransferase